jgi:hypothetical protein
MSEPDPSAPHERCEICDNTGWVCENHPRRPSAMFSKRADACNCGAAAPCAFCNPCGGPDDPPDISRTDLAMDGSPGRKRPN